MDYKDVGGLGINIWHKVIMSYSPITSLSKESKWCEAHDSSGRYYRRFIRLSGDTVDRNFVWYFEFEQDALIFKLKFA